MPFQIILMYNVQIYNVLNARYRRKLFYISTMIKISKIISILCAIYYDAKPWREVKQNNCEVKYFRRRGDSLKQLFVRGYFGCLDTIIYRVKMMCSSGFGAE